MMKCEEVQELMPDYADGLLSEVTRRRIDNHLTSCRACDADYALWKDSGDWMKSDREQYHAVAPSKSIVDAVMARILSEEKWAIPIGRKVFTVTARMRRVGACAAIILLMLCSFTLYVNTSSTEQANSLMIDGEVVAMGKKAQVITSSMQTADGTYVVEPQPLVSDEKPLVKGTASIVPFNGDHEPTDPTKPNYGIVLSVFGILVTVLSMSWLTRA
jgi:predicted anti-sigma-YlaC factor YlaD